MFVIFLVIIQNIFVRYSMLNRKSFYDLKSNNHNEYDFSILLKINEYSKVDESNAVVLKNSLNAESAVSLWNEADKKSDPESSPLVVVKNILKETQNAENSIEKVLNYLFISNFFL